MSPVARSLIRLEGTDAVLAEVVEDVTNKFHAGEAVDIEVYVRAHPEHAASGGTYRGIASRRTGKSRNSPVGDGCSTAE